MTTKKTAKNASITLHPLLQKRMEFYQEMFTWCIENWDKLREYEEGSDALFYCFPRKLQRELGDTYHIRGRFDDEWHKLREKKAITFKDLCHLFYLCK